MSPDCIGIRAILLRLGYNVHIAQHLAHLCDQNEGETGLLLKGESLKCVTKSLACPLYLLRAKLSGQLRRSCAGVMSMAHPRSDRSILFWLNPKD